MPGPEQDSVVLNGITYPVKGPVVGTPISEWEAGIKVGPATYDQRLHAFYASLNDFSGGLGHRRNDLRETLGTYWDSYAGGSADMRRPGHITLPPKQTNRVPTAPVSNVMTIRYPSYPHILSASYDLFGFGSSIYSSTDGITFTQRLAGGADSGQCQALAELQDSSTGSPFIYAAFNSKTSLLAGTARYQVSADTGTTWGNGATNRVYQDIYSWDGKLLAFWGNQLIYMTLTGGVETWNIDIPTDGKPVWNAPGANPRFVGAAEAPWGPAIYVTNSRELFRLNFFARKAYKVDLGNAEPIRAQCMWGGMMYFSGGYNVIQYDPSRDSARMIGIPIKDGVPPSLHATTGDFLITALFPADKYLMAVLQNSSQTLTWLFVYNGSGWSALGQYNSSSWANFGFMAIYPSLGEPSARRVVIPSAANAGSTTMTVITYKLPMQQIPSVNVDDFEDGPMGFITSWMDLGFSDLDGVLYHMICDGFNLTATETVTVGYRLNNDESIGFTPLIDPATGGVGVFNGTTRRLRFGGVEGVQFRTVQFQVTLDRGATITKSPELADLTVVYNKKPDLRTSWQFEVDVSRLLSQNPGRTFEDVYQEYVDHWNTKTLLPFSVPNLRTTMHVEMSAMPVTLDNFRDAVAGQGKITVTVLEPISGVQGVI